MTRRFLPLFALITLALACGDDSSGTPPTPADMASDMLPDGAIADMGVDGSDTNLPEFGDCDSLDPSVCALPWPSNLYLAEDDTTPSGYALNFGESTLPANKREVHISASNYDILDGYGLGTPIMAYFEDLDSTDLAGEYSIESSMADDSPTLLFEENDGALTRVPHWVELDQSVADGEPRVLFMRPAVVLNPSSHYIVAFRNLANSNGERIEASAGFAALRDSTDTDTPDIELRRSYFDGQVFGPLETANVSRDSLTLAWDFRTGSEENLHRFTDRGIELALAEVGDTGASFDFEVESFTIEEDENTAHRLSGTMTTPSVLRANGSLQELNLVDGTVELGEPDEAPVYVTIPQSAAAGEEVGIMLYGHGMLGSGQEVFAGHLRQLANDIGYIMVGVDFRGMSAEDLPGVLTMLTDMSKFTHLGHGCVQGIVQTQVLARSAFTSLLTELQTVEPNLNVDTTDLQWFGASQGGIFGASILATAPDMDRGVLAVPGINYSMLLQRSVNFESFFETLANFYQPGLEMAVVIAAAQQIWDLSDPVSYWGRLLREDKEALLLVAKGDKQVAVVTTEILARTYEELPLLEPYDSIRQPWMVNTASYPHDGSGLVLFDFGNPWPTGGVNRPPITELPDPHSRLEEVDDVATQMQTFFDQGRIIDICGGDGCTPQ